MMSNRPSPLWPYVLILTGLFVLSIAIPSWQSGTFSARTAPRPSVERQALRTADARKFSSVMIVRPAPASTPAPTTAVSLDSATNGPKLGGNSPLIGRTILPGLNFSGPIAEAVAQKIADFRRFSSSAKAGPPPDRVIDFPPTDFAANPFPMTGSLVSPSLGSSPTFGFGVASAPDFGQQPSLTNTQSRRVEIDTATNWPLPSALLSQLDRLSQYDGCRPWANRVRELCIALCGVSADESLKAGELLRQLHVLVDEIEPLAKRQTESRAAGELHRLHYALQRRLALWEATIALDRGAGIFANVADIDAQRERLSRAVTTADAHLKSIPYGDAWRGYLFVDDLSRLANADGSISDDDALRLARTVIDRLLAKQATESQRQLLAHPDLQALVEPLRAWTTESVDNRKVLSSIEQYEASGLTSDARAVMMASEQLKWSAIDADQQLAAQINEHYRNANIRMTFTAELLGRMLPEQQPINSLVRDRILGTPVRGTSDTTTHLDVRLVPDPHRMQFWLEARGTVDSLTHSSRGPVTVSDRGESTYLVCKAVVIDQRGIGVAKATGQADSHSQLTGVSTNFDRMPLVGTVVRNCATAQHDRDQGAAMQEVEQKVASQASQRVDEDANRSLQEAESLIRQQILSPLQKLSVNADPVSFETTAQRMTMRLRVAGNDQLGGHTARPQAPSDALASMQLHESALNNVLDHLQLAGRTFTLPELFGHLAQVTSQVITAPDDLPADVRITFAPRDPVRVRCLDGAIRVTLAIDTLRQGTREWHDFSITATYGPEIDHLHALLVRQGPIELGGEMYKGQPEVVLRGIFAKVLPRDRKLDLLPSLVTNDRRLADLSLIQCVIDDGWIGIAIGRDRTARASGIGETTAR